jgi:type I restriction enzyme S subunit
MPGLNMGLIKKAEVPVPPIDVQIRFRELKQAVEERLVALEESRAQLETLFASLQQRAFRGEL